MEMGPMFPHELSELMHTLFPLRRYFCSPDYERAIRLIEEVVPLRRHEFSPEASVNHWQIPPSWDYTTAKIYHDGDCIYDASDCALKIVALSAPFTGTVSREELRRHLHFDRRHPDWVPWHFRQLYRPWERNWGFCVPQRFYESLKPGDYDVVIETLEGRQPLTVVDYHIQGRSSKTVVLVAHLDHPHMANDDLAGVMVGLRIMQLLADKPRKFSYRLVLVQEVIGSEYYLDKMRKTGEFEHFFCGLFLEMLGTQTPFALQTSYVGDSPMDKYLRESLDAAALQWCEGPFATVIGNDETNWEAHGVSMPSLSRFPYEEYHSDRDNMDIIDSNCLEQAAKIVMDALDRLEDEQWVIKTFKGVPCLSNPSLDLYVDPGQVTFGEQPTEQAKNLRRMMSTLPMELASVKSVTELAEEFDLPRPVVAEYLGRWKDKELVKII